MHFPLFVIQVNVLAKTHLSDECCGSNVSTTYCKVITSLRDMKQFPFLLAYLVVDVVFYLFITFVVSSSLLIIVTCI